MISPLPARSGEVQAVVGRAMNAGGQLFDTAGNIARIVGNTLDPRAGSGGELLRVLQQTTAELAKASASPEAQEAFCRLVDTLTRLGTRGAPLVGHPASEPAQALLAALGNSLPPVLEALEPVLEHFATAVGGLVEASGPLLPAVAGLVAGLLLAVVPLLEAAAEVLRESAPELQRIADSLVVAAALLVPLPTALIDRGASVGAEVAQAALPPIADLSAALAEAVVALQPVLLASETVLVEGLERLQPVLLGAVAQAGRLARGLAVRISAVVSPAADPVVVLAVRPA